MKAIKFLSVIAVAMLFFVACSGDDAKKVADKINSGITLSQSDYGVMIDYCGKYATEAQKYQNQIDMLPDSAAEATKDVEALAALGDEFPYLDMFNSKIAACTPEEVGKANVDKINRFASLIWFQAPDWATAIDDPNLDGFIEQMPAQDSDSAVISTGVGEAVSK